MTDCGTVVSVSQRHVNAHSCNTAAVLDGQSLNIWGGAEESNASAGHVDAPRNRVHF
jgi:hypothetical protein